MERSDDRHIASTMVLTIAQNTAFFTDAGQMGLTNATFALLNAEGIIVVADLDEFDKDDLEQIAKNLRNPGGGGDGGILGAKSLKRLIVACDMVRFYNSVGRAPTAANMQWNPIMKNFAIQWQALCDKREEDDPDVPKISKTLPIMKWRDAFKDYLGRCIGARMIPLSYVVRADADVPALAPPLLVDHPHSEEAGSVEQELINRALHTHPLFRDDNATVYYRIEEATRSTQYAASIKPFQRRRDGRGAFEALVDQHAGHDKWNAEVKKHDNFLHTAKWKGSGNYPLESFCTKHRLANEMLKSAVESGIAHQLPTEFTRVGFLLDAIETTDPQLQAAMAAVKSDADHDAETGKRYDFESTVTYLTPNDPVIRRRGTKRQLEVNISSNHTTGESNQNEANVSSIKSGIGKTGVALRYHSQSEYKTLTKEQKQELYEWRSSSEKKDKSKNKKNSSLPTTESEISALVEKRLTAKLRKIEDKKAKEESAKEELKAAVISCLSEMKPEEGSSVKKKKTATVSDTQASDSISGSTLQDILRRVKNPRS